MGDQCGVWLMFPSTPAHRKTVHSRLSHTQQCAQVRAEAGPALPTHKLLSERGADMSPHSFHAAVDRLCPPGLLLPLLQCVLADKLGGTSRAAEEPQMCRWMQ